MELRLDSIATLTRDLVARTSLMPCEEKIEEEWMLRLRRYCHALYLCRLIRVVKELWKRFEECSVHAYPRDKGGVAPLYTMESRRYSMGEYTLLSSLPLFTPFTSTSNLRTSSSYSLSLPDIFFRRTSLTLSYPKIPPSSQSSFVPHPIP